MGLRYRYSPPALKFHCLAQPRDLHLAGYRLTACLAACLKAPALNPKPKKQESYATFKKTLLRDGGATNKVFQRLKAERSK